MSAKIKNLNGLMAAVFLAAGSSANAQPAKISVDVAHPTHEIAPTLWGIFFEDINLSADGGIYPELVRNRSFEDSATQPDYWKITGATATIDGHDPLNTFNLHNLRVNMDGPFTLENDGYWGMNIVSGNSYTLKLAAHSGNFTGPLTAKIVSSTGQTLASGEISDIGRNWEYHSLDLTAAGGDPKSYLEIFGTGSGTLFLDMISLMPDKTWKNHGLRGDLADALKNLHPSFMRFPGGSWIEGDDVAHIYHWKDTIGDVDTRTPLWNTWGYNTTQALGFYEYLKLCEDLGAEPLFGINCGIALGDKDVPLSRMGQWIQDALDAIEYANSPTNSVWGGLRAQAGHPAPFNLKYMEIGNENGGTNYAARWALLVNAIRAKYPEIQLITTSPTRDGVHPIEPRPDIIDEHYYEWPEAFMRRSTQYDHYDRKGPKIFIGEYAVTQNVGQGNLRAAIGEAAFMTGMERNSDIVEMASYAPLFVNVNHRAWNPDLIDFDGSRWYGIPSYYVQQMFSENRGNMELPVEVESPNAEPPVSQGAFGVGTWNTQAEFKDIKVTAADGKVLFTSDFSNNFDGWKKLGPGDWSVQDGVLQQHAEGSFVRALAGDKSWADYTITLQARKLGGQEGFQIFFHVIDDEEHTCWNIGGWGNTQDAIQSVTTIDAKPGRIETGRWYDIRLEVSGARVKCFLDGKLVHDADYESDGKVTALYACASQDNDTGDAIVKVVNASIKPLDVELDLNGAGNLTGEGGATVLTSENPTDENSLENPTHVAPRTEMVHFDGNRLTREFPGDSFTVLRLHTKN
jgi:alpha-L-arabinofuranosidase